MTDQPHPSSFVPAGDDIAPASLPATSADPRHGGWTPARQAAFLRELAATHNVSAAARAVGMGRQSAYKLRARLRGGDLHLEWDGEGRPVFMTGPAVEVFTGEWRGDGM